MGSDEYIVEKFSDACDSCDDEARIGLCNMRVNIVFMRTKWKSAAGVLWHYEFFGTLLKT